MIVKTTDFKLDAYIPNVDDAPNSDIIGNANELQGFIDKYEKEILIRLLGWKLFSDLKANFEPDGSWKPNVDQKWKDLVDGKDNYRGMKDLIIGFVFWKFIESDDDHYTTAHVVKERTETARTVESRPKAISQYRKFYEHAIGDYYKENVIFRNSIFGNFYGVIWTGAHSNRSNFKSLYEFLNENKTDYPDWTPEAFKNKNYFDV